MFQTNNNKPKKPNIVVYDIESFRNFFLVLFYEINSGKLLKFRIFIDNFYEINEYDEMIDYLKTVDGMVGFNNCGYDAMVMQYMINEYDKDTLSLLEAQYRKTDDIINNSDENSRNFRMYVLTIGNKKIPQLDLYLVFHYNNKNKATSLKYLQYSMDYWNIEEMPHLKGWYCPYDKLQDVEDYCKNDVLSTYNFYKIATGNTELPIYRGIDKIGFRKELSIESGRNVMNANDVKIGEQMLKNEYAKSKGISPKSLDNIQTNLKPNFLLKETFPEYVKFEMKEMRDFIQRLGEIDYRILKEEKEHNKTKSKKDSRFRITFGKYNTTHVVGLGGLHSEDPPRIIIPNENQILRDADVGLIAGPIKIS